jgi:hypothetical protein
MQQWPSYVDKVVVLKPDSYIYDQLSRQAMNQQSSTDGVLRAYLINDNLRPIPDSAVNLVGDKGFTPPNAKLLVFAGDVKPWNWYTMRDHAWLKSWEQDSFWQWRHHRNEIEYLFNGSKGNI